MDAPPIPRLVDLVHAFNRVVVEQFEKRVEKLPSDSIPLWRLLKLLFKILHGPIYESSSFQEATPKILLKKRCISTYFGWLKFVPVLPRAEQLISQLCDDIIRTVVCSWLCTQTITTQLVFHALGRVDLNRGSFVCGGSPLATPLETIFDKCSILTLTLTLMSWWRGSTVRLCIVIALTFAVRGLTQNHLKENLFIIIPNSIARKGEYWGGVNWKY